MHNIIVTTKIETNKYACTASPVPTAIQINNMANSKESFIGVLKRTIDKAPTNPSESVIDDFTINTTKKVVTVTKRKDFATWLLL